MHRKYRIDVRGIYTKDKSNIIQKQNKALDKWIKFLYYNLPVGRSKYWQRPRFPRARPYFNLFKQLYLLEEII